jgi:alkylhydroperoxidase family enzyme
MAFRISRALWLPLLAAGCAHPPAPEPRPASPRVAPLPPEQWSPETRALLEATVHRVSELEGREPARPLPILTVIARHPKLLGPFIEFTGTIAARGVLPRRESELLALRVAWRCRSEFEWGHHVIYAKGAGVTDGEIERLSRADLGAGWSARDRALLSAADELHASQHVSAATWSALARHWDDAQLVEIPFVVGQYTMLSMVAESLAVPVEPELPKAPW